MKLWRTKRSFLDCLLGRRPRITLLDVFRNELSDGDLAVKFGRLDIYVPDRRAKA